ncbi:hypothetical protein SAMN04488513_101415 [Pseudozobellia thermophila]|uniref:NB-ARC domain-containing protein n=2 Tax=Pseudozobellia thermophila TaxID=192903 RepID=A0A1M6BH17_9FLAO|nr:hypothetical protein SAMN04488513_101415 [Pseudozobellia thermophila]
MIIYSLETSLGNYIINADRVENITEKNIANITSREIDNGKNIDKNNIAMLVESSYLDEVFNLAIDTTTGTSYESKMKALKSLCANLNIFDIRNAISHPNRPFPDTFWFRAAAIASDPLILQLDLGDVRQALNSALDENLSPPPEDWLNNVHWAIPNTLPTTFDHEITGLLGRDKEFKDLETTLSKVRNNLIAVVAPGGVGKTALVLQFLKDISLSPKWSTKIHCIIFCTLKNERLTPDGIELIEAINGIDQIKNSILHDIKSIYPDKEIECFKDACEKLENEKILICIDNLENLLIHTQEEFIEFNESLPLLWRVIVTSRISIDSATTVPLQTLGKRHAVNLCRNYFKRRGVSDFKQEDLELIAHRANNNPLAIRLTVDLYIRGIDISTSINKSQKDIAAFSYTNLIESLSNCSISILEAIYVTGEVVKTQLIDLLDLSNDEISESINELSKTSLIVRSTSETGNDKFKLSDSIKDLLLINPRNIEVRNKISQSIKERKTKIQEQLNRNQILGINEFDAEYISEYISDSIRALVVDLNKVLGRHYSKRNHSELVALKSKFGELIAYNSQNHELLFHYSRILRALQDEASEVKVLDEALTHKLEPRYLLAKALNLFHNKHYNLSNEIFEKLLESGYGNPEKSSKKFSASLTKLNFLCLLNLGEYISIINKTEDWETNPNWSVMMGTYRASAFKRSVELIRNNYSEKESAFGKVIEIFNEIFKSENYVALACNEALKFLKELSNINYDKLLYSEEFLYNFVQFVKDHYFEIINTLRGQSIDSQDSQSFLKKVYSLEFKSYKNPLHDARWYTPEKVEHYDQEHIEELEAAGYTITKVYNIPDNNYGMSSFIFAKDKDENQFFLHVDNFEHGWNRWGYIRINDKLAIKYDTLSTEGATTVSEIKEIDKYEM